jgi:hypothetical protein
MRFLTKWTLFTRDLLQQLCINIHFQFRTIPSPVKTVLSVTDPFKATPFHKFRLKKQALAYHAESKNRKWHVDLALYLKMNHFSKAASFEHFPDLSIR